MIKKSEIVKSLCLALFCVSLILCLYFADNIEEIIRLGVCAIIASQSYCFIVFWEVLQHGDKNKD